MFKDLYTKTYKVECTDMDTYGHTMTHVIHTYVEEMTPCLKQFCRCLKLFLLRDSLWTAFLAQDPS
jgi:hypothetical protein